MNLHAPLLVLLLAAFAMAGCGNAPAATDAAALDDTGIPRDAAPECRTAADCDDGLFCTGVEACADGRCANGARVRCDDGLACTIDRCSEELRRCTRTAPDADHDGSSDARCLDELGVPLGGDCDDADAAAFVGNTEVCDPAGHDDDCDPRTHGNLDLDGDGFEDAACCNGTACGTDCDDSRRGSHPGVPEVCNHIDDDCNGRVDEGVETAGFHDRDFDGYGGTEPMTACGGGVGFSVYDTDCNDALASRNPGQLEFCDGLDNDCDPRIDESAVAVSWYRDLDGDGFGSSASGLTTTCSPPVGYSLLGTDCDDTTSGRSPAAPEVCNAIDDDCSGAADYAITPGDLEDDDADGVADLGCGAPRGMDCNDRDAASGPGTEESCDGRDNDCDSRVDELVMTVAYFRDEDGDGWGSSASGTIVGCVPQAGYVRRGGDCDDTVLERHPMGAEGCNATDDDCDGAIDEGDASLSCVLAHTRSACVFGICQAIACEAGYLDCSVATAGCESDGLNDASTCGGCTPCSLGSFCSAGHCAPTSRGEAFLGTSFLPDSLDAMVALPGGDVLVGGRIGGMGFSFNGAPHSLGLGDGFVARLHDGVPVWWQLVGGVDAVDGVLAIAFDPAAGAVYVAGGYASAVNNLGLPAGGGEGATGFVAAFAVADGALLRARAWPTTPMLSVTMHGLAFAGGALYVVGEFAGDMVPPGLTAISAMQTDGFVARINPTTLAATWVQQLAGPGVDGLLGVVVLPTGEPVVTGTSDSAAVTLGGASFGAGLGNFDILVASLTSSGAMGWVRRYGGTGADVPGDATLVGSDVVVVGRFEDSAGFGLAAPLTGTAQEGFIARLRGSTGAAVWAQSYGSPGNDDLRGVTVDASGNLYAVGGIGAAADLGLGTLPHGAGLDLLVLSTTGAGLVRFTQVTGELYDEVGTRVVIDSAGRLAIGGQFEFMTDVFGVMLSGAPGDFFFTRMDL